MLAMLCMLVGCAPTRHPVPGPLADTAQIAGMPGVRDWGGSPSDVFLADLVESSRQAHRANPNGWADETGRVHLLAISGGGADGAFGAGLLCGWSEAGTRPTFKLVTGISTGALIAPFAFLGSDYDSLLKEVYTTISTKDVAQSRGALALVFGSDAFADSAPLGELIRSHTTEEVLAAIAVEHEKGRRLYIGTTNLDARRFVVWNMGAIAAHRTPEARELFAKIMLASASIPAAFPPVLVPVEANGEMYDEMHVDGGVSTQVFLFGVMFRTDDAMKEMGITEVPPISVYVIRNARIGAPWQAIEPRIMPIVSRTVSGMISSQGIGDLYRVYTLAKLDGIDFNLAFIPDDYESQPKEPFDKEDMNRLFDRGFQMASEGYSWHKTPPGLQEAQADKPQE
jgi:hypothetical protein